jgi:hypothetical protein
VIFYFLSKAPHIFNYVVEITEKNAPTQYLLATRMLRVLNFIIVLTFLGIYHTTVNESTAISTYFLPTTLIAVFGSVFTYLILSFRKE